MQRFYVPEPGEHIEDMDMFHAALVLYVRLKGRPCIRLIPLPTGEPCSTPAECSRLLQLGSPLKLTQAWYQKRAFACPQPLPHPGLPLAVQ